MSAGDVVLAGTLVTPDAPTAVVVFVHGSGPMDRNQNSKQARLNVFDTLAASLEQIGVASLRYDKRGIGASTGDYLTAGQDDLLADLHAVVDDVTARGLGPVYLCGHSEGTALAVALADQVEGLILLCPYRTPGPELLRWQAEQAREMVDGMTGVKGRIVRAMSRMFGGPVHMQGRMVRRVLASDKSVMRVFLRRMPARWMRDFLTSDVAALHAQNTRPTLVLVAARDAQCPPADGVAIAASNPNATLVTLDDLSHLLRHTTKDGFDDYARQLSQPMDARVAATICDWFGTVRNS